MPRPITLSIPAPGDNCWDERDAAVIASASVPVEAAGFRTLAPVLRAEVVEDGLELRVTVSLPDELAERIFDATFDASLSFDPPG